MKRSVFVVEGLTEFILSQRLIQDIGGTLPFNLTLHQKVGNQVIYCGKRAYAQHLAHFQIQLINAGNDEQVRSHIDENLKAFAAKGMDHVFGLRDFRTGDPRKRSPDIVRNAAHDLALSQEWGLEVSMTIARQEIEAWFLSVPEFFERLDATLTVPVVNRLLGYDVTTVDLEMIPQPSVDIHRVLRSVNLSYSKKESEIQAIVARQIGRASCRERV